MRAPCWYGTVLKGKIKLDNAPRFTEYLAGFEGKKIELVLRNRNVGRSEKMNDYYWGVVVKTIADELGYEPKEMHKALKEHLDVKSTAKLNTAEFKEYLERVRRFAAQKLAEYSRSGNGGFLRGGGER